MRGLILVCGLFFCSNYSCYAQDYKEIGRLKQALEQAKSDTTKVRVLINIGLLFESYMPDSSLFYFNKGLRLSNRIRSKFFIAKCLSHIGVSYYFIGDYEEAYGYLSKSLKINRESLYLDEMSSDLNYIGLIYHNQSDYLNSTKSFKELIALNARLGNAEFTGTGILNLGLTYMVHTDYTKAADCFYKALEIGDQINDKELICYAYSNLALIYQDQGRLDIALECFRKTYDYYEHIGNTTGMAAELSNMAVLFANQCEYELAIEYYNKAYVIFKKEGNKPGLALVTGNLGAIYSDFEKFDLAEEKYLEALEQNILLKDIDGQAINLNNLGNLYFMNVEYEMSIKYLERALLFSKRIGNLTTVHQVYKNLSAVYFELNEIEDAIYYRDLSFEVENSILDIEKTKAIAEIETKYKTEKKEKQILVLKLEKESIAKEKLEEEQKTRMTLLISSAVLGLIIMFFIIVRLRSKNREMRLQSDFRNLLLEQSNRLNEGKQIERERIAAELHDGIGSQVNGVYMHLDRLTESEKSEQYKYVMELQKIGTRIRNLSHQLNDTHSINNHHLSHLISDLCILHQTPNFKVEFKTNKEIENLNFSQLAILQIYTIIQESLHNTMKHANATHVSILLAFKKNQISLKINDNGKGMVENYKDGFGLKSIKKRIKTLKGQLEIGGNDGVFLRIQFPLKTVIEL